MTLPLGKIYASIGAIAAFAVALGEEPDTFLSRHANGDWGEVDDHDRKPCATRPLRKLRNI